MKKESEENEGISEERKAKSIVKISSISIENVSWRSENEINKAA